MKKEKMYANEKLNEALYFLLQMRQSYVDREHFIYNMNAFLNSARNVTFTLQAEFTHVPKFRVWYLQKQKEMKEDKLMGFFIDLRDVSVHQEGFPKHRLSLKVAYLFPKDGKTFEANILGYSKKEHKSSDKIEVDALRLLFPSAESGTRIVEPVYTLVTDWQFEKAPEGYRGKDILALCIEYHHKLKKVLEEAELVLSEEQ